MCVCVCVCVCVCQEGVALCMCGHMTCVVVFLNLFSISGKLIVHAHDDVNRYGSVHDYDDTMSKHQPFFHWG